MNKMLLLIITIITLNSCMVSDVKYINKTGQDIEFAETILQDGQCIIEHNSHNEEAREMFEIQVYDLGTRIELIKPKPATVTIKFNWGE